jgi:hypothetical protein
VPQRLSTAYLYIDDTCTHILAQRPRAPLPDPQVAHEGPCAVAAGRAHHAAAGVRPRAAEVEALERRAVGAEAHRRARVGQLVQAEGPMEDVASV